MISGKSEVGKSEVSLRISAINGYKVINVGDLLLEKLNQSNINVNNRVSIGRLFFQFFDVKQYQKVILDSLEDNMIVDGIRLRAGLKTIQRNCHNVIHLHKTFRGYQRSNFGEIKRLKFIGEINGRPKADISMGSYKHLDALDEKLNQIFAV